MTTKITDDVICDRIKTKNGDMNLIILRKNMVAEVHQKVADTKDPITIDQAASMFALNYFLLNIEGITDDEKRSQKAFSLLPECVTVDYQSCKEILNDCPQNWDVPVIMVAWNAEEYPTPKKLKVICSRCGKTLTFSGNFIQDARMDGSKVIGIADESEWDSWLGTVCQSCKMIFCEDCQEAGGASPCRNCGKPVVPASKMNLPSSPKKLSLNKPPFSEESLPNSQRSNIKNPEKRTKPNSNVSPEENEKKPANNKHLNFIEGSERIINTEENMNHSKRNQKRKIIGLISLVLVVGGIVAYFLISAPQRLYSQAQNLFQAEDYQKALITYQDLIRKYPKDKYALLAAKELPKTLLGLGVRNLIKGDLTKADESFKNIFDNYPDSEVATKELPKYYLVIGSEYMEKGDLLKAEEYFMFLFNNFPNSQVTLMELPEKMVELGKQYVQNNLLKKGFSTYKFILEEYPNSNWVKVANENIQKNIEDILDPYFTSKDDKFKAQKLVTKEKELISMGEELGISDKFSQSIRKFNSDRLSSQILNASYLSAIRYASNLKAENRLINSPEEILSLYDTALSGLASDTGSDGKYIIDQIANDLFCESRSASGEDSKIVTLDNHAKKTHFCDSGIYVSLDDELIAKSPNELRYAIMVDESSVEEPACEYDDGYSINRKRLKWNVVVHDLLKDRDVINADFWGSSYNCAYIETFTIGEFVKYERGDLPSMDEIRNFLNQRMRYFK